MTNRNLVVGEDEEALPPSDPTTEAEIASGYRYVWQFLHDPGDAGSSEAVDAIIRVFIDTMVVCTCTTSIILISGVLDPENGVNGIELT